MDRLFTKAFKMPFKSDGIAYIFDANGNMVLQTIKDLNPENMDKLCRLLNCETDAIYDNYWEYDRDREIITQNGQDMYSVRGWGYLTGIGGLDLEVEDAILIQDDLGEYIAERMRKNDTTR